MSYKFRYTEKVQRTVYLNAPTVVVNSVDPKKIRIPKDMLHVHKYHEQFLKLEAKLTRAKLRVTSRSGNLKDKL